MYYKRNADWSQIKELQKAYINSRKEMNDDIPETSAKYLFSLDSAAKIEFFEEAERNTYKALLEGTPYESTPDFFAKHIPEDVLQATEDILSSEIAKTNKQIKNAMVPSDNIADEYKTEKRIRKLSKYYHFLEWDKNELFSKLKFEIKNIEPYVSKWMSDNKEHFNNVIITASWENTDPDIIIDGHIIAEIYDASGLLVDVSYYSFPKMGTASSYSNGEFIIVSDRFVWKSSRYSVVFKPYALWEIKPRSTTAPKESRNSYEGLNQSSVIKLATEYDIKVLEDSKKKGKAEYEIRVKRFKQKLSDLKEHIKEEGIEEILHSATEKFNSIVYSTIELPDYTPLDESSSKVEFMKSLEEKAKDKANKIGHEKYIMHDKEKIDRFERDQNHLRYMGDQAVSLAYVEKEHSWATWGGIAQGLAGPGAGIATALQTQMENRQIRERNAIRQVYAQALKQEYYDLARQNEWKRPVARSASEIYGKIKFIKWDQKEIFDKLSIATSGVTLSDDKAGLFIKARCVPLDNSIVIDGTIRAKMYDENHIYVGQALMILPENGTIGLDEEYSIEGVIANPPKSSFYTVEYEPYYLWEIQIRTDKNNLSEAEIAEERTNFRKPDLKELSRKHEDELHYANAIRLFDANQMISSSHAFYKAQAEVNLISDSPDTQVYFDGFKKHTASFQEETYTSAVKMLKSNNYVVVENAIRHFDIIPDWKDSKKLSEEAHSKIKELHYQSGLTEFKKKRYASARSHFEACIDWKDSKEYIEKCDQGKVSQKKGTKAKATILLIVLVIVAIAGFFLVRNKQYNEALSCISNGEYDKGYSILSKLGKDDEIIVNKYDRSLKLIEEEKFDKAITILSEIIDYNDSAEQMKKATYGYGIQCITDKEYSKAIDLFSQIIDYNDSPDKIKEAHELLRKDPQKGDIIKIGHYNNNDLEWQVLKRENNKVLLLCQTSVGDLPLNEATKDNSFNRNGVISVYHNNTWDQCSLRSWLNDKFISSAFTSSESKAILTTTHETTISFPGIPESYTTKPTVNSSEKIFILSNSEYYTYLTASERKTLYERIGGSMWSRSVSWYDVYCLTDDEAVCTMGYKSKVVPMMWVDISQL